MMDAYTNVRPFVDSFLREHPELKEYELLLLMLSLEIWQAVGCDWPSCTEQAVK